MSNKKTVDYLDEDPRVVGQEWSCLSFLMDKENKSKIVGVKSRGNYRTYDEACAQAEKLRKLDPYFNVFVGPVGKWLPFNPSPDSEHVQDQEYSNSQLNAIMKGHKENQERAKQYHQERKNEMVAQNMEENKNKKETNKKEQLSNEDMLKQLDEKIKQLENETTEI